MTLLHWCVYPRDQVKFRLVCVITVVLTHTHSDVTVETELDDYLGYSKDLRRLAIQTLLWTLETYVEAIQKFKKILFLL